MTAAEPATTREASGDDQFVRSLECALREGTNADESIAAAAQLIRALIARFDSGREDALKESSVRG